MTPHHLPFALPAALLLAAAGLTGCDTITYTESRQSVAPAMPASAIDVQTRNGSVKITGANRTDTLIKATLRSRDPERLKAAQVIVDTGPVMKISVAWPDGPQSQDGASFDIAVPDASGVTVATSNGSVTITGLAGLADLRSSNGSVRLLDHGGSAKIRTSNGSVVIDGITGTVETDTSNGSVTISDAEGSIAADTSNGSVKLDLAPSCTGPVSIATSNGSVTASLSPALAGQLTLRTSNGGIAVKDAPAGANVSISRTTGLIAFPASGPASSISTSNGRITISFRAAPATPSSTTSPSSPAPATMPPAASSTPTPPAPADAR